MPAITDHPALQQPKDRLTPVWRYMDFAKYVALLKDRALWFSRLDKLGDPFEGSLSLGEYEHWKAVAADAEAKSDSIPPEWRGKYFDILMATTRRARFECYVSCWHANESESEAMWKLYGQSQLAIAIRSTYQTLTNLLPSVHSSGTFAGPFIGQVQYIDHTAGSMQRGNTLYPVMHKRLSFKHESECRAVLLRTEGRNSSIDITAVDPPATQSPGENVQVDLRSLVSAVVVSPSSPEWFLTAVRDVTERYGFQFEVQTSSLGLRPYL